MGRSEKAEMDAREAGIVGGQGRSASSLVASSLIVGASLVLALVALAAAGVL